MIKRTVIILLTQLLSVCAVLAAAYTPQQIPNVHVADSMRFVSDPDNILSAQTVASLDMMLKGIRRTSSAEAAIVIVDNIEGQDIDSFATELFELWGLGKDDKDNGLLILVAKDLRRAAIRPGYGLEGVLPDITCGQILREKMFPEFAEGNYDTGLLAATSTISQILNDPMAVEEIMSRERDADTPAGETDDFFYIYITLAAFAAIVMLFWLFILLHITSKLDKHERYARIAQYRPVFLIVTFLGLGIPLVASLPLIIILQHWRNSPRICNRCGSKMKRLDEATDNQFLDPGQDLEEQLGSVDYDVWHCPDCNETDIEQYVNNSSVYKPCPRCSIRAYSLRSQRILIQPTTRNEGAGVRFYHCRACGYDHDENYRIPRKQDDSALLAAAAIGAAAASGRGGGFGGGFGGGGFGGGSTGGGGASGGW